MNMKVMKQNVSDNKVVASKCEENATTIAYIKSAIESLGERAKNGDILARESIANLSVVMFDLQ